MTENTKKQKSEGPNEGPCFCKSLTVITRGGNLLKCTCCGSLFIEIIDHGDGVSTYWKIKQGIKNENSHMEN